MSSKPLVLDGPHGRIEISGSALDALVAGSVAGVDGARIAPGRKSVEVEVHPAGLRVDLSLAVDGGRVLPDVGEGAQRAVADAVRRATGKTTDVDVTVVGVEA